MDSRELAIRISTIFGVSRSQVSADPGNDPALDWAADVIEAFRAATLKEAADRAVAWYRSGQIIPAHMESFSIKTLRAAIEGETK